MNKRTIKNDILKEKSYNLIVDFLKKKIGSNYFTTLGPPFNTYYLYIYKLKKLIQR
jgi:hypothetical protein